MFIFGGLSPSGPLNDLFVLDTGELRLANTLGREKQSCVCVCACMCACVYTTFVHLCIYTHGDMCANLPVFLSLPAVVPG